MTLTYGTDEWNQAYDELIEERSAGGPPFVMGTPEWVAQFQKSIQGDAGYKEVAKKWEGSVVIHILPKPEVGLIDQMYIFMDLWHGDCSFVKIVPPDTGEAGDFVLTGEYERWREVIGKEIEVVKGMMQGKIKVKGDQGTLVRNVKAATRLVDIAISTNPRFPDELPEDEVEGLRELLRDSKEEFGI